MGDVNPPASPLPPGGKVGYLGPAGTFTEEALDFSGLPFQETLPFTTVEEAILAADRGEADCAFVPIENSIEGSVNATLDALAFDVEMFIQRELVMPIRHLLVAKPGTDIATISTVASHPQATAQCRRNLQKLLPRARIIAANSTAEAALAAAGSGGEAAAICNGLAAELYGLAVLEEDLEDHPGNVTRFVLLGKQSMPPSGDDKSSMVCFIHADQPGSLLQILQEFAYRYINLSKIESRPTKKSLGDYVFFIDSDGHVEEEPLASALKCLNCKLRRVKLLGSYPRFMMAEDTGA